MNNANTLSISLRTLAAALLLLAVQSAWAGIFSVTPVRVYMKPHDRAVAITLKNDGDTPVVLQADIYSWSQDENGKDKLDLTEDMLLSPPIIKLAPGAHQVVRLAMLKARDPKRQMTYRMILHEVPEALKPSKRIAVPIALALNLPIFITPPHASRQVRCAVKDVEKHAVSVQCRNSGNAYAQLRSVTLKRGDHVLAHFKGGTYILPGAARTIKLQDDKRPAPGKVTISLVFDDFQGQDSTATLP